MAAFVTRWLIRITELLQSGHYRIMDRLYQIGLPHTFAKCGKDVHIHYPFTITGPQFAEIGNNVHINRGAFIRAEGGLKIEDNVHIARNLVIYTVNHDYSGQALPYDHTLIKKPVVIGKNVWIGINVTIVPGVTIGEGAIIGAGTAVSQDVPPMAIVGSTPQRILKWRDEDHYRRLEEMRRYGGISGKPYDGDS